MGLDIQLDYSVPFNPNLNPEPALRPYTGVTSGLLASYQLDLSPDPTFPVAGSHAVGGSFVGTIDQTRRGYKFKNNTQILTSLVPGSALTAFSLCVLARRTGVTPGGGSVTASLCGVGPATASTFRIDLNATTIAAGTALTTAQTGALTSDTSVWDFYVFIITTSGCKLYRPRLTMTPVTGSATITSLGASNLNNPLRIGTNGTNLLWSESEVMAVDVFGSDLSSGSGVATQYAARLAYADAIGITLGVST